MSHPARRVPKKAREGEKNIHHIRGFPDVDSDTHVWVITDSSDAVFTFGKVVKPARGSIIVGARGLYKHDADTWFGIG